MAEKNQALKYILIGVGVAVALGVCGVGSCVALVGGGAFWAFQAFDAPAQEAKLFLEDLSERKLDQARERTSKRFRGAHTLEVFEALMQKQPGLLEHHADVSLTSRALVNGRARIGGTVRGAGGLIGVELELVEEAGKWWVDEFRVAGNAVE